MGGEMSSAGYTPGESPANYKTLFRVDNLGFMVYAEGSGLRDWNEATETTPDDLPEV